MYIHPQPVGGAFVVAESEVSPVTLYTKQRSAHKRSFIRQDERWNDNYIQHFLKTIGFHQKYSDAKTPAQVSILKRAELNQVFSPPANQSNFSRRDLQFVMSQIEENNFVVQMIHCSSWKKMFLTKYLPLEWTLRFVTL